MEELMAEETTAGESQQAQEHQSRQEEFAPITSQDEFEKRLGKRLDRERSKYANYDELTEKAKRLTEIEEANKTEMQRAVDRAETAERERESAKVEALRLRVAAKHSISDEDADLFLTGSDEASLTKQAERLAARESTRPRSPRPNGAQGADETKPRGDWLRDQFART